MCCAGQVSVLLADASTALEMLGFTGPEVKEGVAYFREKRPPEFDPISFV